MKLSPYWWEGQPDPLPLCTDPPSHCTLLIVGAGYTGLSAAITAAEQGAQVCVVDAEHPGFGASSRNGGMCGAHPRLSLSAMAEKFGRKTARAIFNEAGAAFDHFQDLIQRHKIRCDFEQTGRVQLAWSEADFKHQKAMAEEMLRETSIRVEILSKSDLKGHIKTSQYFGGLFYPEHGGLHPRKFVDGLLAAALRLGVTVVAPFKVDTVSHKGKGFYARATDGREITADHVLVATNGYTQGKGVLKWLRRRVFPLPSYIVATCELKADLIASLAPGRRMMVETHPRHSYWRLSPDGRRLLWGGRAAIRQIDWPKAAERLQATMLSVWPDLKQVDLTHAWSGNTGYNFTSTPQIGKIDGIYFASGYCGGGVVLAPYLGMKAARHILGLQADQTGYFNTALQSRPYYFGESPPLFLEIADRWYHHAIDWSANRKGYKA